MPKITVLMSAYNASEFIEDAVKSVLNQSLRDFELLVMDDGSSDSTLNMLKAFKDSRLKIYTQKNAGKSVALNHLLKYSKGEYFAIQDADDLCEPNRLELLSKYLDNHNNVGLVQSGYFIILNNKLYAPRRARYNNNACRSKINNYQIPALDPTLMVRESLIREIRFDESLRVGQGYDFILKVGERVDIEVISDPLYHYRFHFSSITKSNISRRVEYLLQAANSARERRGDKPLTLEEYMNSNRKYLNDPDNNLSGHFIDSAYWSMFLGLKREAYLTSWVSFKWFLKRLNLDYLKPLVYALLPAGLRVKVRNSA